jgi:anti-anti-sigma factor
MIDLGTSEIFSVVGARIIVNGDVGVRNRQALKELVFDAIRDHGGATIDLRNAGYLDSSALAALITCAQHAKHASAALILANANAEVRELIERLLGGVFTFVNEPAS